MRISQHVAASIVVLMLVCSIGHPVSADSTFRGIPKNQQNNLLYAPTLDRLAITGNPFFIDVQDSFARTGPLDGSDADLLQIGFVPPRDGAPWGELTGQMALDHGRWRDDAGDYASAAGDGGRVSRITGQNVAIVSTPWRVDPVLGDYYHLEMTAMVAAGERVTMGYLGDVASSSGLGLETELGQLVLQVERGTGALASQLTWAVAWYEGDQRQVFSNTVTAAEGEELLLQLGWLEQSGNDLFDAWLGGTSGNVRLAQGAMGTTIDIHAVGFELTGTGSWVGGFTAAVPEPASGFTLLWAAGGWLLLGRRLRAVTRLESTRSLW